MRGVHEGEANTTSRSSADSTDPVLVRAFWAFAALVALVFFAPLMVFIALAVKLQDGGPVIFAHSRIGRGGKTFPCLKFRSMAVDADARLLRLLKEDPQAKADWERDFKLRHDPRVTSIGRFLRKSSLDELPQLFNVLRGEMNFVGPRPIVQAEVCRYGRWFREYCQVNPGITGLWQISGRTEVDYDKRVALDVLYVRTRSFIVDFKIVLLTIPAVLMTRGAH